MTNHVLSGLPRSGSTLLAALLRQKPRNTTLRTFNTTPTGSTSP